ncbi:hypothetical protein [Xanthomonas bonasiae]|uniref:hypothetical protein n=1 Tax=Xanthomonas bonasiae TaxID=2810351 RepID=UPI0019823804|nr:hypothetical protein [Xanthomonas bonasiae]
MAAIIDEARRRNFDGAPHLRSWKEMHRQCFIGSIEAPVCLRKKCAGDACFSSENEGARTVARERSHSLFCVRLVSWKRRLTTADDPANVSPVSALHDNRNTHDAVLKSRCRIFAGLP